MVWGYGSGGMYEDVSAVTKVGQFRSVSMRVTKGFFAGLENQPGTFPAA
jgi:hypothetical protein